MSNDLNKRSLENFKVGYQLSFPNKYLISCDFDSKRTIDYLQKDSKHHIKRKQTIKPFGDTTKQPNKINELNHPTTCHRINATKLEDNSTTITAWT